jgi:hypothetical protein
MSNAIAGSASVGELVALSGLDPTAPTVFAHSPWCTGD